MARINILPKNVAELIAAGEVVERPSSVVKELIENSIDAGATSVTVEIKNGGIKYIRVTDNGCGIYKDDVRKAFISHATSKIKDGNDLEAIFTLGFRGEALPSVAAVSRLQMLTKTPEEETGTEITVEGGEETSFSDAGAPDGTTIIIRDLFYNTPARMKFLKKDSTEGSYVSDVTAKAAISNPSIRFSLIKDGKQVLSTPGNGDLRSCIYSVFGKDVSDGLLECDGESNSVKVKGFISKPLFNRPNRNLQYCYVNGRYVRVPVAAAALDEAYKNRIMVGKFPMCFLFIDIPPGKTDVNVHPAKTEIRFSEDAKIFEAIFYAAKAALNKGDTERPGAVLRDKRDILQKSTPEAVQMKFSVPEKKQEAQDGKERVFGVFSGKERVQEVRNTVKPADMSGKSGPPDEKSSASPEKKSISMKAENDIPSGGFFRDTSDVFSRSIPKSEAEEKNRRLLEAEKNNVEKVKEEINSVFSRAFTAVEENGEKTSLSDISRISVSAAAEEKSSGVQPKSEEASEKSCIAEEATSAVPDFTVVGEIFKTYILVESENKMLIIDKHAAHERMIFNRLQKEGFPEDSQLLLSPVSVTLSGKEYAAVIENLSVFSDGGFTVEDFGGTSVIVRDCPVTLTKEDIVSVITEMAGELLKGNSRPVPEKLTWLYHSTACRRAVKAGDSMKKEETEVFVRELLSDPDIRYCPHGRPVMYELTKHEIEKQFGRIQ
ncbi:MAG: DNA mismatch repair endonuclease MutL [Clostridia bacterium]|nr:DNA mismatch repair endonuclease MutL [Clostridia bacterium]